jgi:predicted lipoprotein
MFSSSKARHLGRLVVVLTLSIVASACRIERKAEINTAAVGGAAPPPGGQFQNQSFDPKAQVGDIWSAKVLPALQSKAGEFVALRTAMKANLDAAGAKHGHRERGEGAPWNFSTRLRGVIVELDVESSAGRMGVDVDGDGKADAQVQIGPILRGTSLRDSLPFISFTAYSNQVEFAQLANAFNDHAYASAMKALPRSSLNGKTVELLGTFTTSDADEIPAITPAQITLDPK